MMKASKRILIIITFILCISGFIEVREGLSNESLQVGVGIFDLFCAYLLATYVHVFMEE